MDVAQTLVSRMLGRPVASSLVRNGRTYLADFFGASREVGIRPFLMWGTLLGCVRENRLLLHDQDLDVGMVAADYFRRDALIAAMRRRGYRLDFHWPYKLRFSHWLHSLWIDVDVFYPWDGRVICSHLWVDGRTTGESFPAGSFDRLRDVEFLGIKVSIPDPPETVLEAIYGDWRVPRPAYNSASDTGTHFEVEKGLAAPALDDLSGQFAITGFRSAPASR